uniref:DHC_N1 domain-containing protein n=1 Tax=Heterorhabditis bacteriophora TaxID=37862 RepID=A0A1I7XR26_HETBA
MDSGNESSTAGTSPIEVAIASREAVTEYVKNSGLALLGSVHQNGHLEIQLSDSEAVTKFITDPQTQVLVIDRTIHRDQSSDVDTGDENETAVVVFSVRNDVLYKTERSTSIVFMKRSGVIEADKPIPDQLRVIVLNEGNPYETLLSIIGKAMTPYFKSFIKESGRGERDGDKLAPTVEKNLNEAEVALLHLQQNIDIPEINLVINPHIQSAIQKASKEGRKDSQFLNNLQNGVNRWIKEIRKVLLNSQYSRVSLVSMTFYLGLKQTMALVNDYNSLMKDFPLNELVSATDLDSIKTALGNVFTHMKKIRSTKYPINRALRLVEAISRDMNVQILKVLGTRRLMHISMVEFDQLMTLTTQLFTKWDDEYDKQIQLKSFRKQHEQLRVVIERVLRPVGTPSVETQPDTPTNGAEMTPIDQVFYVNLIYNYRFNALFCRPQILGAVREYQTQLIQRVKEDIERLQVYDCTLTFYYHTNNNNSFRKKILARQLKTEGDNFRQLLNTQPLFDNWVEQVQAKGMASPGKVFTIERRSKDGKPQLYLKVNFSTDSIVLHKETYDSINGRLNAKSGIDALIATYKKDIQSQIAEGNMLTWESYKIDPYVGKLADTVNNYQERVEELILIVDKIEVDLAALETCQYSSATIGALLASIQKSVDQLVLGNYSNLSQWVNKLDKKYRESNVALPPVHPVLIELAMHRDAKISTYKNILSHLPGGLIVLEKAYTTVDRILKEDTRKEIFPIVTKVGQESVRLANRGQEYYFKDLFRLSEDREKMRKARNALDMADPKGVPADTDKLAIAAEELTDLKGVWQALTPVYTAIDEMKVWLLRIK